jgi:hypothetical protein
MLDSDKFFVCARPDGERCLVTTGAGITKAVNLTGHLVTPPFKSSLPNGGLEKAIDTGKSREFVKLDCIYNRPLNTYFIVDCLKYGDMFTDLT